MSNDKSTKIDSVVNELKKRIEECIYTAGQRLPSEMNLASELNVSRDTVRKALLRLQSENIIDIVPKSGSFVRSYSSKVVIGSANNPYPNVIPSYEVKQYGSYIRAMEAKGKETLVRFIEPSKIIQVGQELGEKMQTDETTEVLRRYRVHIVDRVPYRILDSYYLASLLGELLGKDEGYIPLFKWMYDNKNERPAKVFEKISVRMPDATESEILKISRTQPVVDMDRWVWTESNILFEYSRIIANASLHEYTYSYDIDVEAVK